MKGIKRKMKRYTLTREFYIPKNAEVIRQENDAIVYGYTNSKGHVSAIAFHGKANKPDWHYYFSNIEQRDNRIESYFKMRELHNASKEQYKREKAERIAESDIKAGDYFVTSWGYDQTNYDYLIVVRRTAKTAECRMVTPIYLRESGQSDAIMPGTANGELFRMKISGKDTLNGHYPYCENSYRMGYFSRTTLGTVHYQTNPIFGH